VPEIAHHLQSGGEGDAQPTDQKRILIRDAVEPELDEPIGDPRTTDHVEEPDWHERAQEERRITVNRGTRALHLLIVGFTLPHRLDMAALRIQADPRGMAL
jgi:hypothetical protein